MPHVEALFGARYGAELVACLPAQMTAPWRLMRRQNSMERHRQKRRVGGDDMEAIRGRRAEGENGCGGVLAGLEVSSISQAPVT